MFKKSRALKKPIIVPLNCYFCNNKVVPDYKEARLLEKYMSERGKILGKGRTGVCSTHQRLITTAIKHARQLAILPFVVRA